MANFLGQETQPPTCQWATFANGWSHVLCPPLKALKLCYRVQRRDYYNMANPPYRPRLLGAWLYSKGPTAHINGRYALQGGPKILWL